MFLSKLVLSGKSYTRESLPLDYPGGWDGYIEMESNALKIPYLLLALALIFVAVFLFFVKLPKVAGENESKSKKKKTDRF